MSNPYDPNRPEQPGMSGGQYPPQQYPPQYSPQQYPPEYQQQQPPYPGYPQYPNSQPYYPQPGPYSTPMMPPPMPPKKSNKMLWIVLSIVGGVVLVSCIACVGVFAYLGSQVGNSPIFGSALVVGEFCGYEQRQRYDLAYNLLSPSFQSQMTQDQFVQASQAHDSANGTVQSCQTVQGGDSSVTDTSASFELTVTRTSGTDTTGTITLVKTDGNWKVDSIDSSLALT